MSDVKAFTGFIAVDGSTHNSRSAAIAHSREVKIKAALQKSFHILTVKNGETGETFNLDEFIYTNRDEIVAALNQEVLTRKKRAPNKKAAGAAAADAAAQK
ncbi:hypothetical protein ATN89_17145 [Comamonas thiooxydans]|uniref:hypothetical protein n=1 Tax=Comamonas thiooxydans TaxID=363952 RepID=UPI0007C4FB7A|nr:hypothetical protein [Comamonas thiooxydans]OAD82944.1 hypothetical protein ATN89_17145 [Comamonas thiooxydans]